MHKAGFVNIIGKPNVGKSTLINALMGEKLSIVTAKAQTTRHRILGILSTEDSQLIFSDTPGIIDDPKYMLHERMMNFVHTALEDADVVLYLVEAGEKPGAKYPILEQVLKRDKPVLLVINKIDTLDQEEVMKLMVRWQETTSLPMERIIPVSALKVFNTERVLQASLEIPYSVEVVIVSFIDEPTIIKIAAEIYVNRASQKPMIIGKGGEALKQVGTHSRKELEENYGKKVFLEIFVKVKEDWRENTNMLRHFGYE